MQSLEPCPRKELAVRVGQWSYLDYPMRLANLESFLSENLEAVLGDSISILERYVSEKPARLHDFYMYYSSSMWGAVNQMYQMLECLRALKQVC